MAEISLPDGDYILSEGAAWLTVSGFSVRVRTTDKGVVVDLYPVGKEDYESVASTYAFFSELEEHDG